MEDLSKPRLEGVIDETDTGDFVRNGMSYAGIALWVTINNLGMDSVVLDYNVVLSFTNGQTLKPDLMLLTDALSFSDLGIKLNNIAKDALYNKTAEIPIQRGGSKTGILIYLFKGVDLSVINREKSVILTFDDVTGKRYSISINDARGQGKGQYKYIPGMSLPTQIPQSK